MRSHATPLHIFAPPRSRSRRLPAMPQIALLALLAALLALAAGCERFLGGDGETAGRANDGGDAAAEQAGAETAGNGSDPFATAGGDGDRPVILFLGDSLTAGHGLPEGQAYPAVIRRRLREEGYPHRVVNAGVSGDTSEGGLARLDWLLQQRVDVMVLALGANDGLRGVPPEEMRANLAEIIERAQAEGIRVVLAGMKMPTNYGGDYRRRFDTVFPALAEQYDTAFIPFLLDGVALKPELNQGDGIHPNAEGQRRIAEVVWPVLEDVLEQGR